MNFQGHKAVVFGISGETLLDEERELFAKEKPLGFILFSRNIRNKDQVRELVQSLRDVVSNPNIPILLDQEGGRVARLKEPIWYHPFPAAVFSRIADKDLSLAKEACEINAKLIARDMFELNINVDCAPVADILQEYSDNVIGDRSYSSDKEIVYQLADSMAKGLLSGGVQPIIKHIPGHGRAAVDSHLTLPEVDTKYSVLKETDFYPFEKLKDYKWAMTAHVLYKSIDPDHPATLSKKVIKEIRDVIGFKGIIISDCITMKALMGTMAERASEAFDAGCDVVIYSGGKIDQMRAILSISPSITKHQEAILSDSYKMATYDIEDDIDNLKSRLLDILENNVDKEFLKFSNFDPTEQLH